MKCTHQKLGVPAGFDIVDVHSEVKNVGSQSALSCDSWGNSGLCDSAGEGPCNDAVITRGCAVDAEWHNWHKMKNTELGLPYSNQVVCAE